MSADHDWYFDDFEVGQVHTTMGRTVTEADLVNFVTFGGIFEEIFINAEYAKTKTLFNGRVVPGLLILVVAEGLYVQTGHTHQGRAYLGLDDLRLKAPVLCGDTIHAAMRHRVVNQKGVEVMSYKTTRMLASRPSDEPVAPSPRLAADGSPA
jgi:acyl dehydratase